MTADRARWSSGCAARRRHLHFRNRDLGGTSFDQAADHDLRGPQEPIAKQVAGFYLLEDHAVLRGVADGDGAHGLVNGRIEGRSRSIDPDHSIPPQHALELGAHQANALDQRGRSFCVLRRANRSSEPIEHRQELGDELAPGFRVHALRVTFDASLSCLEVAECSRHPRAVGLVGGLGLARGLLFVGGDGHGDRYVQAMCRARATTARHMHPRSRHALWEHERTNGADMTAVHRDLPERTAHVAAARHMATDFSSKVLEQAAQVAA